MTLSTIATNKAADLSPPLPGQFLPPPYALAFWLILLAVALLGVANCALVPPFEEYDSIAYWSGIQQVADTGKILVQGQTRISTDVDAYAGPRIFDQKAGVFFNGRLYRDFFAQGGILPEPSTRQYQPGRETNYEGQQPPLYFVALAPAYLLARDWSWPSHMLFLRLVSWGLAFIGFAAGTIAGARVLRDLSLAPSLALLLPAWPLLFPEFIIDSARLGTNGLSLCFAGIAWAFTLRLLREPGWFAAVGLGAALGLGLLTKVFFVPISLGVGLLFLYQAFRLRSFRPIISVAIALGIALLVGGGWYLHNWLTMGSFTNFEDYRPLEQQGGMVSAILARGVGLHEVEHFLRGMAVMAATFVWAGSWSRAILWPVLAAPILLMAAIAFLTWIVQWRRWSVAGLAPLFFVAPFAGGLVYHQLVWVYSGTPDMAGTPGWHLQVVAPAFALALALGWHYRRLLGLLAAYAVLFNAACWASQASFFSGCAYPPAPREPLQLEPGSCLIDIGHLAVLGEPMLAGLALLLGTSAAGAGLFLAWRERATQTA